MHNPTVSRPLAPLYKLHLFGRFRIERRDPQGHYCPLPADTWDRQSPRRVLTYLLLAPGRHTLKDPLLDVLCPDDELERAQAVLSQALSLIRHVLLDEQGCPLLLPRKATAQKPLVLAGREQIWCDWDEFEDTLMQRCPTRFCIAELDSRTGDTLELSYKTRSADTLSRAAL